MPKLLFPNTGEVAVSVASGIPVGIAPTINTLAGIGEIGFALALVLFWRWRLLLLVQIPLLLGLLIPIAFRRPSMLTTPFQPLTLNLSMAALALCALVVSKDLPSARNCRRMP